MIHRSRRIGAVVLSIVCMCSVAACGSSSKSGSGSTGTTPSGHFSPVGFNLTSAQRSCLKKKGVTLPTGNFTHGSFKGGRAPKGKFPKGGFKNGSFKHGKFPKGKFPAGAHPGGFRQNSKFSAAFKACGVSFPSHGSQGTRSSTTG